MTDQVNGEGTAGEFTYFYGNGTSFASPLVAGEAALLLARAQELGLGDSISADSIEDVILNATTPLSEDPTTLPNAGARWARARTRRFPGSGPTDRPRPLLPRPTRPSNWPRTWRIRGTVELNWADGSDNNQGFIIERAQKDGKSVGNFEAIAEVDRNSTNYTDNSVASATTYVYYVASYNIAATNSTRRAATVTTP